MVNSVFFNIEEKQNAVSQGQVTQRWRQQDCPGSGMSSQDENLNLDQSGGGLWLCPSNRDWNLRLKEGHVKAFTQKDGIREMTVETSVRKSSQNYSSRYSVLGSNLDQTGN